MAAKGSIYDEILDSVEEQARDVEFRSRLEALGKSEMWTRMEEYLCFRREQLFSVEPTTTEGLWKREGSLAEIQTLLRRGPVLLLEYERWRKGPAGVDRPTPTPALPPTDPNDGLG